MTSLLDRYNGCLIGLAIGDALGAPVEFKKAGEFKPVSTFESGGSFNLSAGQWTDDTSMALCLADSLVEKAAFDPIDQLERYVKWYREGYMSSTGHCFDIGTTTEAALKDFESTRQPYRDAASLPKASNGSIMRLAPVVLAFRQNPQTAIHFCGLSSKTTHPAKDSVDACRYLGALMWGAINGEKKEVLLSKNYFPLLEKSNDEPLSESIQAIAAGSFKKKNPPDIKGTTYATDCLEAALWAFYHTTDFEHGCLKAVNLGDDADTTGAVFGQIAGSFYGFQSIPPEWREGLFASKLITDTAMKLLQLSKEL
jgi:ADP-ribosyl-[dinitrogen reductase] hydrolase